MESAVLITICSLLLLAYVFNITAPSTRIPSFMLLLILGWSIRQITVYLDYKLPNISGALPVLATIGLILIVLEGSLELKLDKSKTGVIAKSFFGALLPMAVLAAIFTYAFHYFGSYSVRDSLINAIPLCVISSAIAIPSAANLNKKKFEFVVYESSFSDIIGVILFNFIVVNVTIDLAAFTHFGVQLLIILVVSIVATLGLSALLHRIEHHIKFVPIILLIIMIYAILKLYHLPALIFILIFGLFIENLSSLRKLKWFNRFHPEELQGEIKRFKDLTIEGTFLIRAIFFIVFGYLIETADVVNLETLKWSVSITAFIFVVRALQLWLSGMGVFPLLFIAPRGLITILLFLSIAPINSISIVNQSLIIQVIILSGLIMTVGLVITGDEEPLEKPLENENLTTETDL